jgi:hypothetical protein
MGAGAGVPREVTVSSSSLASSRGSTLSRTSSSENFVQASQEMLGDLNLQDLSRKFSEARSRLRHYDCSAADERLKQHMNHRQQLNAQARKRKNVSRHTRSVVVSSYELEQNQCISPPHMRGSLLAFDSP